MTTRRLYYDDSYLREFDAQVVSCEPVGNRDGRPAYEILLDETAFYPTSGGQPHDLGRLDDAEVLEVRDDGDEIVHVVDRGFSRGKVHGCIHWSRRMDHMQQHTGQHLLSGILQERFGLATVSFHLGTEASTIDVRGNEPSDELLEGAERAANEIVFDDRAVTVRYGTAEKLASMGVRKEVERTGILRAIEIEGVDLQPCGGTHVRRTSQIGVMLVRGCSKIRADWRIEFVCGRRTERVARMDAKLIRGVAEKLHCADLEVVDAAGKAMADRDTHFRNARTAMERLAAAEATLTLQQETAGARGFRVIARLFQDEGDGEYLGAYAAALAKAEGTVALLGRSPCGHLFFAQHPSAGKDMNALLKQIAEEFGAKGGGTRDFARGRLADGAAVEKALARARTLVGG